MNYLNLGRTGLRVSRLCLGMMSFGKHESREWALDEAAAEPIVRRAVEGGIIFFDTADVYNGGESEVVTGRLLRKLFEMREEYVVATKVHGRTMPGENGRGLSQKHILASIDASLECLGLDYVDLYQIHRWDRTTPIDETMEALHDAVKAGKARYIGASSMYAWQFAKAQRVAQTPFVSMQNHYNLIYRKEEREMIPQCIDQSVGVLPWSPLARGRLAGSQTSAGEGRTTRANTDPFRESLYKPELDSPVIDRLAEMAAERGVPPAQVALAWLLHKPGITAPIVGATKLEHVEDALAAEALMLTHDDRAARGALRPASRFRDRALSDQARARSRAGLVGAPPSVRPEAVEDGDNGGVRIVDLSHHYDDAMPIFPGLPQPSFRPIAEVERDGYAMSEYHLLNHIGTHVDAPSHQISGGDSLDDIALERLITDAVTLDVSDRTPGPLSARDLESHLDKIHTGDIVFLYSNNGRHWGSEAYWTGWSYPDAEGSRALIEKGISAIGFDGPSADPVDSTTFDLHRIWLGAGRLIIENVTNLDQLPERAPVVVAPLKVRNANGAPVRIFALVPQEGRSGPQ